MANVTEGPMKRLLSLAPLAPLVFACASNASGSPMGPNSFASQESLCVVLAKVGPGDKVEVTVGGVYVTGYEFDFLYDPSQLQCELDIDPETSLEIQSKLFTPELKEILDADGRAQIVVRGELLGPKQLQPDDPRLPPLLAYANRIAGRRYGHMGAFRTQLVVDEIIDFQRVPKDRPLYGDVALGRAESAVPVLASADVPTFPEAAMRAGIEGEVELEVRIVDGRVTATTVKKGDRLLAESATANARSWVFEAGVNSTLTATFVYELDLRKSGSDRNLHMDLRLPTFARIVAPLNMW